MNITGVGQTIVKPLLSGLSAVQYELSYIRLHSSSSMGILRTRKVASSQWLDSSVGRAVCTGIAEVMGLNPVQA